MALNSPPVPCKAVCAHWRPASRLFESNWTFTRSWTRGGHGPAQASPGCWRAPCASTAARLCRRLLFNRDPTRAQSARLLLPLVGVARRRGRIAAGGAPPQPRHRCRPIHNPTASAAASSPQRYGTPAIDGAWRHWDHEVLPHWTDAVNRQHPEIGGWRQAGRVGGKVGEGKAASAW